MFLNGILHTLYMDRSFGNDFTQKYSRNYVLFGKINSLSQKKKKGVYPYVTSVSFSTDLASGRFSL